MVGLPQISITQLEIAVTSTEQVAARMLAAQQPYQEVPQRMRPFVLLERRYYLLPGGQLIHLTACYLSGLCTSIRIELPGQVREGDLYAWLTNLGLGDVDFTVHRQAGAWPPAGVPQSLLNQLGREA